MNHIIAIASVSSFFLFISSLFVRKVNIEAMAGQTQEYDNIRSTIYLCIYSGSLLILEMRIEAFKNKNILPRELHIQMCDELDRLFNEKYSEVIEMEVAVDSVKEMVSY